MLNPNKIQPTSTPSNIIKYIPTLPSPTLPQLQIYTNKKLLKYVLKSSLIKYNVLKSVKSVKVPKVDGSKYF